MTQVTLHAIDGSGDLLVEADEESVEVLEKSPGSTGDLFRARISVTVAGGSAQTIDCMIDESTGTVSAGPDVLAALRGHPLDDPAVAAQVAAAEAPTVDVTQLAAADDQAETEAAAGATEAEAAEAAQLEADRAAVPVENPVENPAENAAETPAESHPVADAGPTAEAEPAAAAQPAESGAAAAAAAAAAAPEDGEREREAYRVQYEDWLLGMAPLTMYNAADTAKTIDEMSWSGATGRQALDANTWTVDVSLIAQGTPVTGGPYRLTIRNDGVAYTIYVDAQVFDYLEALRQQPAAGAEPAAEAGGQTATAAAGEEAAEAWLSTVRPLDQTLVAELRADASHVLWFGNSEAPDTIVVDWDDLETHLGEWRQVAEVGWTGPLKCRDTAAERDIEIEDAVLHANGGEGLWIAVATVPTG
jgi:hypothetical protein